MHIAHITLLLCQVEQGIQTRSIHFGENVWKTARHPDSARLPVKADYAYKCCQSLQSEYPEAEEE